MPRKAYKASVREFVCTRTMGVLVPSLHRESTDSLIALTWYKFVAIGLCIYITVLAYLVHM